MPSYSVSVSCPYCHSVKANLRVNGTPQTWTCDNPDCRVTQTMSIHLESRPAVHSSRTIPGEAP
jgi:hypothetical protein